MNVHSNDNTKIPNKNKKGSVCVCLCSRPTTIFVFAVLSPVSSSNGSQLQFHISRYFYFSHELQECRNIFYFIFLHLVSCLPVGALYLPSFRLTIFVQHHCLIALLLLWYNIQTPCFHLSLHFQNVHFLSCNFFSSSSSSFRLFARHILFETSLFIISLGCSSVSCSRCDIVRS